jgi:hypothetical protein
MDPRELLARFPTVQQAVAFVELHLDAELLAAYRAIANPAEITAHLTEVIDESLAEDDPPNAAQLLAAKGQMRTAEFKTYLAGRLGLA